MQYNTAKQVLEFIERNGIQDKRPRPPQCSDKLMQYQEYMTYRLPGLERSESIFRQICKKLPSVYHPEGSTSCHLLGICIGSYSQDDLETSLEEFRFDQTAAPGIRLLFVNGKYETTINIAIEKPNSMGLLLLSQLGQLGYDNITHEKDSLQDSYHCAGDLERFFGGCWAGFSKKLVGQQDLDIQFANIMDIMHSSSGERDSLDEFLVSVFGEDTDIDALKRDLQDRGEIRSLRRLHGGFSAQAVVSLEDKVIKIDGSTDNARLQSGFLSGDYGELNHYIPHTIPGSFRTIGDVALWEMTDVSDKNSTSTRFDRSRSKRVRLDDESVKVAESLKRYKHPALEAEARRQGAAGVYDFIDHYMYVIGLLHANAKPAEGMGRGPVDHRQRLRDPKPVNGYHDVVSMLSPNSILEIAGPLGSMYHLLQEVATSVIHGDFIIMNTLDGALIDLSPRIGNELEDVARFFTDPAMDIDQAIASHFVQRYVSHRSSHDVEFREKEKNHRNFSLLYSVSRYENLTRTLGGIVNKLSLPEAVQRAAVERYVAQLSGLRQSLKGI